jgi:hypothetical protein
LLDDGTVEMAVECEEQRIGLSEDIAKYIAEATRDAAQHEWAYQKKISGLKPAEILRLPTSPLGGMSVS